VTYHVFAPELIREDGTTFADDTDVIVVGTGAGGFTAAITAANNGARVIQLEKAQTIGGTTKKAAAAAREVEAMDEPGLALIERFLHRTIAHRSQLVLPTHGVPPSQSEEISRLRAGICGSRRVKFPLDCTFSTSVSYRDALTCNDASCLT
jgi:2-polyprenyl-6-methoxyphenol hydroxylase-like FAD-dependent oxidoreductase